MGLFVALKFGGLLQAENIKLDPELKEKCSSDVDSFCANISPGHAAVSCGLCVFIDRDASQAAVCLLVGCLTSQQHASVSQGQICSDNGMCCHTEIEVADWTFHLTQSQYTDTGPTSPSTEPIMPGT